LEADKSLDNVLAPRRIRNAWSRASIVGTALAAFSRYDNGGAIQAKSSAAI